MSYKSLASKSFSPGKLCQLCCWPWWNLLVSTLNGSCPKAAVLGSAAQGNLRFCSTHFICGMSRVSLTLHIFSLSYCIPLPFHLAHHRVYISYRNACPDVCWEITPASPSASAPPREIPDLYPACIKSWCNAAGPYSADSERIKTRVILIRVKSHILLIHAFALTCTVRAHVLSAILSLSSLSFVHIYMKGSILSATRWKTMTTFRTKNKILFALLSASSSISCNSNNYRCPSWALFNKRHILDL